MPSKAPTSAHGSLFFQLPKLLAGIIQLLVQAVKLSQLDGRAKLGHIRTASGAIWVADDQKTWTT